MPDLIVILEATIESFSADKKSYSVIRIRQVDRYTKRREGVDEVL